jgi:hypothetical protein
MDYVTIIEPKAHKSRNTFVRTGTLIMEELLF